MSKQQLKRLRKDFDLIDVDGTGKITRQEFEDAMAECEMDQAWLDEVFSEADADGGGDIDFNEFVRVIQKDKERMEAELRDTFKQCDKDGSGFLSADEVTQMVNAKAKGRIPADKVKAMMNHIDKDGDGKVSVEEFMQCLVEF